MQPMEIPSPTTQDSETVVTALETAALFRARGDTAEALRWLQRAAESAGDHGDDARTLALARSAADLSHWLQQTTTSLGFSASDAERTPTSTRRLPKPPSRSSVQPSSPSAGPPPPPSSRAHGVSLSASPLAPSAAAPAKADVTPRTPPRPAAKLLGAEEASELDRITQVAPAPAPSLMPGNPDPRLRQAARVSVTASAHEAGLFEVRILEEGGRPPADASEGFLLLLEPTSTLFVR